MQRTREYVEILRMALGRERVVYDGEIYKLPLPDGPGKPLKLMIAPVQERMPIYIAAIGPNNTKLTGEIADGWLPTFFSPEHVGESRELLEEGAKRGGKDGLADDFDIAPNVNVSIDDDLDRARDSMRPVLALYVGGMGSRDKNFYNQLVQRYGFEDDAEEDPGPVPGRQEGRGRRRDSRRADRHGRAGRAEGPRARTAWPPTATPASAR